MNDRSGGIHEISMEIGGLKQAVENMMALWQRQETAASEGRRALHEKFERLRSEMVAVSNDVGELSTRVDKVADTLKIVEPAVKSFTEEKLRAEGAKQLGIKLWAAMIAAAGGMGWGLHELVGWFRHG